MEDRSDSAEILIVIVQKETIMIEVQVLVVKMERRHIQEMFSRESQQDLLMALIWMAREHVVTKMMPGSWLTDLVVSLLAMGVTEFGRSAL